MKKLLYLFLALMLPGLIFVFLKYAGRNEFSIPVYYEERVADSLAGCGYTYPIPYRLPDSTWQSGSDKSAANLFIFSERGFDINKLSADLEEEMGTGTFTLQVISRMTTGESAYEKWKCIFLINDPWQVVMVDKEGKIRGYYDPQLREELDRLRVEMKILLKKY